MSSTNKTPNFKFPLFVDSDKPTWRGDINDFSNKAETALDSVVATASGAQNIATSAMGIANEAKNSANAANTLAGEAKTVADSTVNKANSAASDASDARTKADAAAQSATNTATIVSGLPKFSDVYTRSEADGKFVTKTIIGTSRAVFVGTSNVVPGTWPEKLCSTLNVACHNYAVSGMGYSFGGDNAFAGQLNRAVTDDTFNNNEVAYVFIADGANDARSSLSVESTCRAVINAAKNAFTKARIIVIPALWSPADIDSTPLAKQWLAQVVDEQRQACLDLKVEFIEGSWTWNQDDLAMIKSGEVHYTSAGYDRVVGWILRYLAGGNTMAISRWRATNGTSSVDGYDSGGHRTLAVKRDGDDATAQGTIRITATISTGDLVSNIQRGQWPARDFVVRGFNHSSGETAYMSFSSDGSIKAAANINTGIISMNTTYKVF